jgi:hypothetical protein
VSQPTTGCEEEADPSVVFVFFSNRLGCFGSLILSLVVTAVLILLLSR